MKICNNTTKTPLAALLCAAALAAGRSGLAQTTETIIPLPQADNYGYGVLIDPATAMDSMGNPNPNPAVFVSYESTQWGTPNPYGHGSIMRLAPDASAPAIVDSAIERAYRVDCNHKTGALFAVGSRPQVTTPPFPRTNPNMWLVRTSPDGSANSWSTADAYYLSSKESSGARAIAADPGGNTYACGWAALNSATHWIIRKAAAGSPTWTTVCDLKGSGDSMGNSAFCDPASSTVFVAGVLNAKWTVLRSQDLGASWQTVDSWAPSSKVAVAAADITADSLGRLYVVGCRGTFTSPTGWVVRMSTDGNLGNWNTVLDVGEGNYSWAGRVSTDASGTVWVSGMTENSAGTPRWTILSNVPTETWSQSWNGRQRPFGETYSKAYGIAGDLAGDVFFTGHIKDWIDPSGNQYLGYHVAVQRLSP